MTEIIFMSLFSVVFYLWFRACLKLHELTQKAHGGNRKFVREIGNQLSYFDQYFGMLFGKPENYSLYRTELVPLITGTKMAFKQALWGILFFILYLVFNFAL
ncbi:hypothetical protein AYI83_17450 [Shewanella algae]|nr:hypothetical protein AYI83_17450 [Shewanella algae]TVO80850.1 hypothetical protein AYI76_18955 [Shewanella algae]TVO80860.1 hypothetical protein AYI78_18110 [Shewanella algae]TVO91655.1 hypothetical protein AYI79_18030 [Shewanella algae]TVO92370.1 hypothetical protein AYI86_19835 [Shewanella algae]